MERSIILRSWTEWFNSLKMYQLSINLSLNACISSENSNGAICVCVCVSGCVVWQVGFKVYVDEQRAKKNPGIFKEDSVKNLLKKLRQCGIDI